MQRMQINSILSPFILVNLYVCGTFRVLFVYSMFKYCLKSQQKIINETSMQGRSLRPLHLSVCWLPLAVTRHGMASPTIPICIWPLNLAKCNHIVLQLRFSNLLVFNDRQINLNSSSPMHIILVDFG